MHSILGPATADLATGPPDFLADQLLLSFRKDKNHIVWTKVKIDCFAFLNGFQIQCDRIHHSALYANKYYDPVFDAFPFDARLFDCLRQRN
jgi:hypothetical protein